MRGDDDQGSARNVVTCAMYRESLSAQMDGEDAPLDATLHLAACADCAQWAREMPSIQRPLRMRAVDEMPDLAERILTAIIGSVPRPSLPLSLARAGLMAIAILQAVLGIVHLIQHDAHGAHSTAESGAWNFAIGIALATAALRPHAAYALLPMVASLVAVLGYASLRDLLASAVTSQRVLEHVLILLGLVLVTVLTVLMRRRRTPGERTRFALRGSAAREAVQR